MKGVEFEATIVFSDQSELVRPFTAENMTVACMMIGQFFPEATTIKIIKL